MSKPERSRSGKILLIDEEGTRLRLIERILRDAGRRVVSADSTEHALALLGEEADCDIAIIKIKEHELESGIELIRTVRRTRPETRIWVVMRTLISRPSSDPLRVAADKALWWGDLARELGLDI